MKEDEEEVEVLDILDAEGIIVATDIVYETGGMTAEGARLAPRFKEDNGCRPLCS